MIRTSHLWVKMVSMIQKHVQAMAVHSKMSLRRCAATVALGAGAMSVGFVAPQALEDRRGIHMHNVTVAQIRKIVVFLKDLMEIRSSTLSRSPISIPMTSISIAAISTKRHIIIINSIITRSCIIIVVVLLLLIIIIIINSSSIIIRFWVTSFVINVIGHHHCEKDDHGRQYQHHQQQQKHRHLLWSSQSVYPFGSKQ